MEIIDFIRRENLKIITYSIISFISIIITGLVLFPSIFYDNWIWKYYWGPVVADSGVQIGVPDGKAVFNEVWASEGYTMISELTYGIILILSLYLIYHLLKKLKIKVNWRFALALLPYIIFGPAVRVLEDANFFDHPFIYFFISPFIYAVIAAFAIFFLLLGYYIEKKYGKSKFISINKILFYGGVIFLLPSLILIFSWILGFNWSYTTGIRFDIFLIVTSIICIIVLLVYLLPILFRKKEELKAYQNPLNLSMLFGHLLDGVTSYISIKDPLLMGLSYSEKHPASNFLLEIWGPLFPIVKFILIIVVIYVFDILYKEELKKYMTFVNLIKIGILILGFSPGLRDLLRVTMGV